MGAVVLSGIAAFGLSLLLTPLLRDVFLGLGLVDRPDGRRKLHVRPVPRMGGIAIAFSYVLSYGLLLVMPWRSGPELEQHFPQIAGLLPAATLIFAVGLVDDVFGLRPREKLGGQVGAALLAVQGGVCISRVAGVEVGAWIGAALTVAWLTGCANALNLIDGLDGLAAGMGLCAALTSFLAAVLNGNTMLALATLPLAGSLAGFLRYNFRPASVFLGDCGSLLAGFLLGCYGVIWSQKSATLVGMTAPLIALAIPLLDVALSILRRWLRGCPIFSADRGHIHHKLLDLGLRHREAVLLLYLACGIYAMLSLLQSGTGGRGGGAVIVAFCLITWAGIRQLGYFEFGVAGRVMVDGTLRRVLGGHILLHGWKRGLARCGSVSECWGLVEETALQLGFSGIQARMGGRRFEAMGEGTADCWQIRVPLPAGDYVNLWRRFGQEQHPGVLSLWVETLHGCLAARVEALEKPQAVCRAGTPEVTR